MKNSILLSIIYLIIVSLTGVTGCSRQQKIARALERASTYFAADEYDKATIEYMKVIRLDSTRVEAFHRLGTIYYEQGKLQESMPYLFHAKKLAPNDIAINVDVTKLYLSAKASTLARTNALFVLSKQPTNQEAVLLLADSSVTAKEVKDAQIGLQNLSRQYGNKAVYQLALGALALRQGDLTNAAIAIQSALAMDSNSVPAHAAMGKLYWMQNRLDLAQKEFKTAAERSPIRSGHRLVWAEFEARQGSTEEAKKILQETVRKAPDYISAWNRLADLAFNQKKIGDCNDLIPKILARHPANFEALLMQARIKLVQNQAPQAIQDLQQMDQRFPKSPLINYYLATAHLVNRDIPKATGRLEQAVDLNPNYAEAALLLSELNLRNREYSKVIFAMNGFLKKNPKNLPAQFLLAEAYRNQGAFDQALLICSDLSSALPKDPRPPFLAGLIYLQMKQPGAARQAFQKANELAPNNTDVLNQLALLDVTDNKPADAIQRIQKAIEQKPKAAALRILMANVYLSQKQFDLAENELHKAIEANPEEPSAFVLLAEIYRATNRAKQAIDNLNNLLAKKPNDPVALMQLGSIYLELKDRPKAIAIYEKVLAANPQSSSALNNLAYFYSEDPAKQERALEYAQKARELMPDNPASLDTLGWIHYLRGEYSRALVLFREAADKISAGAEIQYHLGMAYYMLGQEEAARGPMEKALMLRKEFDGRATIEKCLRIINLDSDKATEKSLAELEARLLEQPKDPVASLRLASLYEKKGALDKALKTYEQALKLNTNSALIMAKTAQMTALNPQSRNSALELAQQARKLAPDDPRVTQIVGRAFFAAGDYGRAASLLPDSVGRNPQDAELAYELGQAYFCVGRLTDAEKVLQNLAQKNPQSTRTPAARQLITLIDIITNPNKSSQASSLAQDILKARPNDPGALMVAGLAQEQLGNSAAALPIYERIYQLYPLFSPVYKRLALLGAKSSETFLKTNDLVAKAHLAYPDDPEISKLMGMAALAKGENGQAVQWLQDSLRKRTNDAELSFYLGKAQFLLNNKSASKTALDRSLTLGLKGQPADEAQSMLSKLKQP